MLLYGLIEFENLREPTRIRSLQSTMDHVGRKNELLFESNGIYLGSSQRLDSVQSNALFETQEYVLLYTGRIFNHAFLASELSYTSDAACFLAAFLKWGNNAANYINGEFAVVIINKQTKQVDFFRDHIGACSLSYSFQGDIFVFATSPFEIAQSQLIKYTFNERYFLQRRLRLKTNYAFTYFNEIQKVIPGYHYTFANGEITQYNYWKPEDIKRKKNISREEVVSTLRGLVNQAVKKRMSSIPMGMHVSGGLDCTGVASVVAKLSEHPSELKGYSWTPLALNEVDPSYPIKGGNEKEFIDAFSQESGVPIRYVSEPDEDFRARMLNPEFEQMSIEEPVMRQAERDGVQLLFSGWGGDEFLSLSNRGLIAHLTFTGRWVYLLRFFRDISSLKKLYHFFLSEVVGQLNPLNKYHSKKEMRKLFTYLSKDIVERNKTYIEENQMQSIYGKRGRDRFIMNLLYNYHMPNRMDSWSYFGDKYGLRYTYPLLDKEVLDYWFSIPIEFTYDFKQSRGLYREVMQGYLMDKIRLRKDKTENLRIQFSFNQKENAFPYFVRSFNEIKTENLVPDNVEAIATTEKLHTEKQIMPTIIKVNRFIGYIQEYNLLKKYF